MKKEKYEYLKIYEKLKKDIINGTYKYGEKMPSKRNTATLFNVSVITSQHVYSLLTDEGYIEAREKRGYFVIYKETDFPGHETEQIEIQSKENIAPESLETGEFSFNILAKTMRKVMLDYGERLLVKSPDNGCLELRKEIAAYLARNRDIHVDISQIIVGSGAEYLYCLLAQYFDKEYTIAIENPCYDKITKVYMAAGHKVDPLKMGKNGIQSSELKRTDAEVLHVTPFHSFPSRITADISKKNEYLNWAGTDKFIIEDNYDSELTVSRKMEDALFSIRGNKNVIYINTFSKTIAPSLRVGYMVLPDSIAGKFHEKLGFYSCTVPVFEQYLICELIRNGDFERHINRMRRKLRKAEG